jgi:mono/diheme cytochrome c family protein
MLRRLLSSAATVLLLASCGAGEAQPEILREGRSVYGDTCSVCHGNRGQGGVGPSLDNIAETFPECSDQIRWVALGSEGWKTEVGGTYGANGTPVTGNMPGHRDRLTEEQIAAVSAFERNAYAEVDQQEALADCGLAG